MEKSDRKARTIESVEDDAHMIKDEKKRKSDGIYWIESSGIEMKTRIKDRQSKSQFEELEVMNTQV